MAAEHFESLAAVSCLAAAAATFISLKMGLSLKILMRIAIPYCLLLIPITGAMTGSFHSHGFDIPWWVFGVVNAAFNFFAVLITVGVYLFMAKKTN